MAFESIHNYYEHLVLAELLNRAEPVLQDADEDLLSDIACVALNQLPARYVRHNVDMVFYMTPQERAQMDKEVQQAVQTAIDYVARHRGEERPATISQ